MSVADAAAGDSGRPPLQEILRSVSRSFYLSIRALPKPLRQPVGLAYLLARTTDTIADTAEVNAGVRSESLRILIDAIQGATPPGAIEGLRNSIAPLQKNAAERALLEALPRCLEWLEQINAPDQSDIRQVLEKINRGQALDVARFSDAVEIRALATAAELDQYTYLVAGCVGEFWARLGFRHLPRFAELSEDRMIELGARYGKGLQLINILRDAGADLRAGRCYLPADELGQCGIDPTNVLRELERVEPVFRKWLDAAANGIAAGIDYTCAIKSRRVRLATALPALIGARTLALLRDAGASALMHKVKVPRREVRRIILACAGRLASGRSIRETFQRMSR